MTRSLEDEVIDHLDTRYASTTAARALWTWAGGDPPEADAAPGPQRWATLWARADAARRVALVREALHDRPGHPLLLDWLLDLAQGRHAATLERAAALLAAAPSLAGDPPRLAQALAALGAQGELEAFACLAPPCDEWCAPDVRDALERACDALHARAEVIDGLRAVRDAARDAVEDERLRDTLVTRLRRLHARAAEALAPDDRITTEVERVVRRLDARERLTVHALGALAASALVSLDAVRPTGPDPAAAAAAGLRDALRATTARPADAEDEDDEEEGEEDGDGDEVWT